MHQRETSGAPKCISVLSLSRSDIAGHNDEERKTQQLPEAIPTKTLVSMQHLFSLNLSTSTSGISAGGNYSIVCELLPKDQGGWRRTVNPLNSHGDYGCPQRKMRQERSGGGGEK